jgi:NADPH:quinone reductase-like Zn-dependent oxidoreductase
MTIGNIELFEGEGADMTSRHDAQSWKPACVRLIFFAAFTFYAASASAQDADTIRQFQFERASNGYQIAMQEVPRPVAGDNEVLVRVRATSLNRRDLNMLRRRYDGDFSFAGGIPLSDGAGEVIAVGKGVTRFKMGDRVAGIFFEKWIDGAPSEGSLLSDRGGNAGGMLSEVVVTHEDAWFRYPNIFPTKKQLLCHAPH